MLRTHIIILAGGRGSRMQSDVPKALIKVCNEPIIARVLRAVEGSTITDTPTVVVGCKHELVSAFVGNRANPVLQTQQLGTGHAVMIAQDFIPADTEAVIVLYGDHPLISADMINKLHAEHTQANNTVTMAIAAVPDFNDWRSAFLNFGRVVRDASGTIIRSIEVKDATKEELDIKEVNPCYLCFSASWMWEKLHQLSNHNAQNEYYLTDLIKMAHDEGVRLGSVQIDAHEALGVNTPEQLAQVEEYIVANNA